eukprot:10757903-Alexandrium_andersonii.AAC.1
MQPSEEFSRRLLVEDMGSLKAELGLAKLEVGLKAFTALEERIKALVGLKDRLLKMHKANQVK